MGEPKKPWEETWRFYGGDPSTGVVLLDDGRGDHWDRIMFVRRTAAGNDRIRLAAAAPDLYRALSMLVDCLEVSAPPLLLDAAAMHDARAALRKARGET